MGVRATRQEVGTVFLLPLLLLLLLLVISVVGNNCGCWGANKIYVHYKPPVSGWFNLSSRKRYLFERVYEIYTDKPQTYRFQLKYNQRRKRWLLMERINKRKELLSRNNQYNNEQIIVSCPSKCSCQTVQVNGSSCWSINGLYSKYSNNREPPQNFNKTKPHDNKKRRSQCLLAQLVKCLANENISRNTEDGCLQYTKPLIKNTELEPKHEHYRHNIYYYNLNKDQSQHDFWLIESNNKVYAVSRNTGPCPDHLTPDSTTWLRTDKNFTENITVTCTAWDNPSGD